MSTIVNLALTWNGTPYHDQARVLGVGVDCAQLVAAIGVSLGVLDETKIPIDYNPQWHFHNRRELMLEYLIGFGCEETDKVEPGCILAFKFGRVLSHLGIYLGDSQFIHARKDKGKVVINTLSGEWLERHLRTFNYPKEMR
jgi:cell wall-associated NlpC family hydrolase